MTSGLAVLTATLAAWLAFPAATDVRRLGGDPELDRPGPPRSLVEDRQRRAWVCLVACAVVGLVVAGPAGVVVGAGGGLLLGRALDRLEPPSVTRDREDVARDLPLAIDLLAACSAAGLPVQAALPHIGRAVGGPVADRFASMQARWALGSSPLEEWQRISTDPQLRRLGRAMVRAHRSGAPVAETLDRLAGDVRRDRRTQAQARARSVGVKVAAPLAACFLPAFMLIGVVPTIVGGFAHLGL